MMNENNLVVKAIKEARAISPYRNYRITIKDKHKYVIKAQCDDEAQCIARQLYGADANAELITREY